MTDQRSLKQWRREQRQRLLAGRIAAGVTQRNAWNTVIEDTLRGLLPMTAGAAVALYWPFKGEFDPRNIMRALHECGGHPGLPAVVARAAPLEFRVWHPAARMTRGVYNIPVPEATPTVSPDVVVAPLVGFDDAGYRLGYGGGYYDRTLAALSPRPAVIGVGYELSRIPTVSPQSFDMPMGRIVTEAGVYDHRGGCRQSQ